VLEHEIATGCEVQDITQMKRTLKIQPLRIRRILVPTLGFSSMTISPNKIEVVVLKLYLKERLQLEFKLRDLSLPV